MMTSKALRINRSNSVFKKLKIVNPSGNLNKEILIPNDSISFIKQLFAYKEQ